MKRRFNTQKNRITDRTWWTWTSDIEWEESSFCHGWFIYYYYCDLRTHPDYNTNDCENCDIDSSGNNIRTKVMFIITIDCSFKSLQILKMSFRHLRSSNIKENVDYLIHNACFFQVWLFFHVVLWNYLYNSVSYCAKAKYSYQVTLLERFTQVFLTKRLFCGLISKLHFLHLVNDLDKYRTKCP